MILAQCLSALTLYSVATILTLHQDDGSSPRLVRTSLPIRPGFTFGTGTHVPL